MPETLTTATPPVHPGQARSYSARVARVEFGDGYAQRQRTGPARETVSIEWPAMPVAEARALRDFLHARGGAEAFFYDLGDGAGPELWSCAEWTVEKVTDAISAVRADFLMEHDIV